jgi:23S rRNA C2498 (ribose-2'-O)-methylase RlmM
MCCFHPPMPLSTVNHDPSLGLIAGKDMVVFTFGAPRRAARADEPSRSMTNLERMVLIALREGENLAC